MKNLLTPGEYGGLDDTYAVVTVDESGVISNVESKKVPRTAPDLESTTGTIEIVDDGDAANINLTESGVTAGVYGDATHAAIFTVDDYGRITSASETPIDPDFVSLNSTTLTVAGAPAYTVNLTSGIVTPGTYGSATLIPSITVDTYGRVTNVTTNSLTDAGSLYAKAILYNHSSFLSYLTTAATIPIIPSTVEVSGTFYTPNNQWAFGPTSSASLSMTTDGRIKYTGATTRTFLCSAGINGAITNGSGIYLEIRKNLSNSGLTNNWFYTGTNSGEIVVALSCPIVMQTNDYVSIFIGSSNGIAPGSVIYCAQLQLINGD